MAGEQDGKSAKGGIKGDSRRAERLAAELRSNLQKRKQRARALASSPRPDDGEKNSGNT